jgi:hypothetical protein
VREHLADADVLGEHHRRLVTVYGSKHWFRIGLSEYARIIRFDR